MRFACGIPGGEISRDGVGSDQMATVDKANTRLAERRWQALALQIQRKLFRGRCGTPHVDIHVDLARPWISATSSLPEKEVVCQLLDLCLRTTLPFDRTQLATRLRM